MSSPPAISSVPWGECLVPELPIDRELAAEVRRKYGALPQWGVKLAPCRWLGRAYLELHREPYAFVPRRLADFGSFVVSQDNSCRYCYGTVRALLRVRGIPEEEIARLERDLAQARVDPRERQALEIMRKVSRANPRPRPDELESLAASGWSPEQVGEIVCVAAVAVLFNRVATMLALPTESAFELLGSRAWLAPLRLVMRAMLRPRPFPPEPFDAAAGFPFAAILEPLSGSPAANVIGRTLGSALDSGILSRRTKLLMLAVIGRASGCPVVPRECVRLLEHEGLGAGEVERIVASLHAPELGPRQVALVPYARDTFYSQPALVQERTRELGARLSTPELLEAVGIAALGNLACRLSVLVRG